MRSPLRTITWVSTGLFGLCVTPVIGQFFVELAQEMGAYQSPSEKVGQAMSWLAQVTSSWWFALALGYLAGTAFALWIIRIFPERKPAAAEPAADTYVDTRLRVKADPSAAGHYVHDGASNIYSWRQTFASVSVGKEDKELVSVFNFFLVFEKPISFDQPVLNSFGHKLGSYSFIDLGARGATFQFIVPVQAPVLEIWFPPPRYHQARSATESVPLSPQSPQGTAQETGVR